jgi:hypothetical protein
VRVVYHRNKERLSCLATQVGSRVSKAHLCITEAPVDVQAATARPYSVVLAQLTTHRHGYSDNVTQQDGITGHTMFSAAD